VALELGGYVPHFKDKLFFFGAFDPSLTQTIAEAPAGAPLASHGAYAYSATTLSWAAKLTYQPFANAQIEASTFGDPTHHNEVPGTSPDNGMAAANATSVGVRYNYGSRDSVARISAAISPTWTAIGSFTYNFNHFDETPAANSYQISNRTTTPYIVSYIGGYEPTKNDDYSINLETEKKLHFMGEHTLSLGYTYEHTNFLDQPSRTGPLAAIPGANAAGTDLAPSMGIHSSAIGQLTNATFRLFNADASCTYCTMLNGSPVYLQQIRGTYKGLKVSASDHYHVGWVNDSYQMNHWVNIDAGLRWEEQWYAGSLMKYLFNDNWSPRLGVNVDPFGKHRDKVFFNYARYQSVLPLDAAIRQLGNEQDDSFFFTPKADASGNAILDSLGVVIPVFDAAHTMNGLPGKSATSAFGNPTFSSSTGEGILPGTKMEYENEYLLGFETQIIPGSVISVRYTDRRLGRVIEDIGSESVEGSVLPEGYNGGIANVTAKTDISVNENEVVYTPDQWTAANGTNAPGFFQDPTNAALYKAPVAGCTLTTVTDPKTGKVSVSTGDTSVGNGDFWRHYDGTPYNGACITNLDTSAGGSPDGKPDGFANPSRRYQELVIEYNRNLKNNWQMRANYRFAKLWGNYEGFFRNDNGQSDPGISSLFDFTAGALGLLGDQTKPGFLNTDRRNVGNVSVAYTINSSDSYVSKLSKLTFGTNLRGSTGNPLSAYASHPAPSYGDVGEVPIGGRGTKGTLPTTLQVDFHTDYPVKLREGYALKLAFDAFNITNTQHMTSKNQNLDSAPGTASPDYGKPLGFQTPFYARASIRLEF
jgi:hypothetical protein